MGLFSNLRKQTALTPDVATARGVLVPSLIVMAADGQITDGEIHELGAAMTFNALFQRIGQKAVEDSIRALLADMKRQGGLESMLTLMDALSPNMRETAICMAIRMAAADGHLDEKEHNALVNLSVRLGIAPERYNQMLDIVVVLQRAA